MIAAVLSTREPDDFGYGHFGASRGSRDHKGIDYACPPNTVIMSPVNGEVTKFGYPYADDLSYQYVQITDDAGLHHRLFYVVPLCNLGDIVNRYDLIGTAQNISARYDTEEKKMNNHIHYEIKTADGKYIAPDKVASISEKRKRIL